MRLLSASIFVALSAATSAGCGYSQQQWQVQLDKYEHERTRRDAAEDRMAKADAELEEQRGRAGALEERLVSAGIDIDRPASDGAGASAEERDRALAEAKARATKVEATRLRVEGLRQKLATVGVAGSMVTIRRNRVVVLFPADAFFDAGKDAIKKSGREALKKLADSIRADPGLAGREFQVAGHTDTKKPSGGAFSDNLGLSAMRARAVALFVTDGNGGGLARDKWSAAGFGDSDPVAPNETDEGRALNRRVEIVLVPSADEVLNLRGVAAAAPPPAAVAAPPLAAPPAPPSATGGPPPPGPKASPPAKPKDAAPRAPAPKDAAPKAPAPKDAPKAPTPKDAPKEAPPKKAPKPKAP